MCREGIFAGRGTSTGYIGGENGAQEGLRPFDKNKGERPAIDLGEESLVTDRRGERTTHAADRTGLALARVIVGVGGRNGGQQKA